MLNEMENKSRSFTNISIFFSKILVSDHGIYFRFPS